MAQAKAATRAARAVFVCSAPLVGQPNAGLTAQGLKLACAEPGDQLAIFGDALRELRASGIETPVLIVSAHQDELDAGAPTDVEVSGYITKPIDFDRLFACIAELTGSGHAA